MSDQQTDAPAGAALTDEERRAFRDEGIIPEGWRWCPDCNGEGTISTMDTGPDLNESARPCTRCEAERGIVPETAQRADAMDRLRRGLGIPDELADLFAGDGFAAIREADERPLICSSTPRYSKTE